MANIVYPPLESVTTKTVDTAQAAHYLNREPQTLRSWSCRSRGIAPPLTPRNIGGRLAWSVADLRKVLGE